LIKSVTRWNESKYINPRLPYTNARIRIECFR
jgi:hypothetical protein